jgi:putative acetyltransferase
VVGWGAIRGERVEGLYTDPEFAGRGIGTKLLGSLEGLMRGRGVPAVRKSKLECRSILPSTRL